MAQAKDDSVEALREEVAALTEQLRKLGQKVLERGDDEVERLRGNVAERPLRAVAIAAAIGFVAALIVRR